MFTNEDGHTGCVARELHRFFTSMKPDPTLIDDEPTAGAAADAAARTRRMYERIVSSFAEHRLAPGTRLREERLAELFEVSRTQVRQVLQRLEHEGLVER